MPGGRPFVLTEAAFEELRREIRAARQTITNLERNLSKVSTRRHEGGFIPPRGQFRLGSLDATLSAGSTAAATEITHNGSVFVNGETFTVTDFFMNSGESVAADTKFIAFKVGEVWVPVLYCDVSDTLPA